MIDQRRMPTIVELLVVVNLPTFPSARMGLLMDAFTEGSPKPHKNRRTRFMKLLATSRTSLRVSRN